MSDYILREKPLGMVDRQSIDSPQGGGESDITEVMQTDFPQVKVDTNLVQFGVNQATISNC